MEFRTADYYQLSCGKTLFAGKSITSFPVELLPLKLWKKPLGFKSTMPCYQLACGIGSWTPILQVLLWKEPPSLEPVTILPWNRLPVKLWKKPLAGKSGVPDYQISCGKNLSRAIFWPGNSMKRGTLLYSRGAAGRLIKSTDLSC